MYSIVLHGVFVIFPLIRKCLHVLKCVQTQTYVKVYNLAKQELTKKLHSGVKWVSSIDIHPQGEHCCNVLIVRFFLYAS